MKQRYSLTSNAVKFRLLTLTLLTLLIGGGMKAIGQEAFSLDYTGSANKTYYVTSTNEVAESDNNTLESGTQACKFYVSESSNSLTDDTKYDHFYNVHVNNASATVTFIFQTDKPVGFSNGPDVNENAFKVTKGTLILKLDKDHYDSDITLRRVGNFTTYNINSNNKNSPFYLINDAGEASHQRLIIEGLDPKPEQLLYPVNNVKQDTATYLPGRQFVIDGAANITSVNMTTGDPTYTGIDTNKKPLFRVETGTLHLTNVTIQNSINSSTDATHGGIFLMLNDNASQNNRNLDVILTHCWLHNLASITNTMGYPGIGLQWQMRKAHGSGSVVIKRSKFTSISNNTGIEPAIRSTTGCKASVTIDSCNINNNFGGGIRWQGLVADPMQVKNTTIKGNYTKKSGGGIIAKSPLVLTACKILNNTACEHGGGINYMCYDEQGMTVDEAGMIYPNNLELTMDAATIIDGNKTETGNGGGIMVWGRLINLTRTGQMGYVYHEYGPNGNVVGPYQMKVNLNGATIQNNTAHNNGGGIYIVREEDASCYLIDCKLSYGNIKGNKALYGSGGGVCINQTGTPNPEHVNADHPAQDIGVYTGGGSNNLTIAENKADQNGGGLYLYAITDGSGWTAVQKFNTKIELNDHTFIQKDSTSNGFGGGVYLHQGNITMNNATIGGSAADLGNYTGNSGGGIYVHSGTVTMLSTTIQHNKANSGNGGGLYVGGGDVFINPNEIGAGIRSKISNNTAGPDGGGVYTAAGKLTAYGSFSESGAQSNHIEIINNKALGGNGGGIYCQGTSTSQSWEYDIRLRRVDIGNNEAGESGGGVYLYKGKISVIDGAINGNTATKSGGGVYTEEGNIDINATRDERFASEIMGNTAGINGGGLNTHKGYIRIFGTSKDQRIPIANNNANRGSGGGIFCMGEGADTQYITMQHADLINNKAVNGDGNAGTGVVAGCGGGMYLQKGKISITDVNLQNNYAKHNGGGINNHEGSIDVNGCFIGSSHSDGGEYWYKDGVTYNPASTNNDTDRGNEAGNNGGGIYTHKGDIDIEDYVLTSGNIFREESKITFNEAGKNGGGINTHMGTIYINTKEEDDQIEVAFNRANKGGGMYANAGTIIAHNALIHDNTATLNGGGANNHSGDIRFYGGSLSNNSAEKGHGGGAYTNVGDIDLFQFPSTNLMNPTLNDGMKVFNNIAKINGGAFNNHTGRVDVRHATLYNNTATNGNGGAIFCEGPHANSDKGLGYTIRLLYSDMVQNKTRGQDGTATDPTGRGGGIYLKYGSIFAHYSNILNNSANINGGGIDNHSGNILLYGCNVQENQAVTGNGGGIFTYAGDITIGPSTAHDGISTTSKPTIITLNTAKQDGGGINNQQGNITINGDIVANNKALEGNGGGVYIADGIIDMNGGRIDYNKADNGQGGGVWSGGGEFNIKDRNATPDPIVLIVDSEVKRGTSGQTATIHYHLIDQGKYTDVTNVEHGIIWGEDSPNTEVVYNDTEGHQPAPYFCKQGEPACQRITIPAKTAEQTSIGIEANKTYKVKAFFRYKTIENGTPVVKTGYSETMEFVTYSSTPLVLSGTVSNITSTSAEGSGKILDTGDSPIITPNGRGVQIWTGSSTPPSTLIVDNMRPSQDETDFFTVDLRKKEGDTYVDLNPNTTYYARAYATNTQGTSYGNTVEFKTLKNTPDMGNNPVIVTTDIVNGVIVATAEFSMPTGTAFGGTNGVKAFGFVWSTDDDPELLQDHTVQCTQSSITHDTTFTASYSPVRPNLTFYVRAFASYNETSVTPTSDITNFSVSEPTQHISPSLDGSPVVRANSISNITQNGANIHGQLHYEGSSAVTEYGVVYSPNIQEPAIPTGTATDPIKVSVSDSPGTTEEFTVPISGLTPGTTYYLRVYAVNAADTAYSNNFNFTALPISQPNVVIVAIDNITKGSAQVHCSVNNGGGTVTDWGIKYSTNSNMSGATNWRKPGGGDHLSGNTFTVSIDNATHDTLASHTTYYVQAYATNSAGTHTCQTVSFQTDFDKPSVVLATIDNLVSVEGTETNPPTLTGTGNYIVTLAGTTPVRTHGVCWSTFHNPKRTHSDVANTHFQDGTGIINESGSSSATMNQRFPNMKYYARAYASTATPNDVIYPSNPANNTYALADIVYCEQERAFLTLPLMQSNGVSNINSTSATLAGTIASRDPEHYLIKYGVCWGMNANPTPIKDPTDPNYDSEHPNYLEVDITSASSTSRPFSINVTGLADPEQPNVPQTYHYRAYAINRNGTSGTGYDFTAAQTNIAYGPDVEFQTTPYTITATANPASAGSVAYTSGLTSGGGWDGSATFTLTASANTDWQFKNWTRDDETTTPLTGNPLTQTSSGENPDVNANDHTYLANFQARVSVAANGTGTVGITAGTVVITGQEEIEAYIDLDTIVTVTATPTGSASFLYWTDAAGEIIKDDDGEPVVDTYTFPLSAPVSLTAHFGRTIAVSANNDDYGTVTGAGAYLIEETCTVTATPAEGYVFSNWTENNEVVVDGENNPVTDTYTFTVSGNRTLKANFAASGGGGKSASAGSGVSAPRPRDIYPAPAREPWDWDDDLRDGEPTVPTVTTGAVTYVNATTATVAGKVTALGTDPGGATLSEAGIWYSTTNDTYDATDNPGTFVAATSPEVGTSFSVDLTDLNADKTYYVRAYAKNSVVDNYGFGDAMSFRYNPAVVTGSVTYTISVTTGTNITPTIIGNKVSDKGASNLNLTAAGIWYSTSGDTYDGTSNPGTFKPASPIPDINAEYSVTLDCNISPDQPCYARAYAINENGSYGFGEVCDVTFKSPKVTTKGVSYTNDGKPQVKGVVTDKVSGDAIVSPPGAFAVGIWYSESNSVYDATGNPGTFKPAEAGSFTTDEYTVTLSELDANETYYARAYVTYNSGTTYYFGEAVSFSTDNFFIVTGNITNVTGSSATVNCTLMSAGTESVSEIGIWYSTEAPVWNATTNAGEFTAASGTTVGTEYSVNLTNLTGFNQYVRAYAKVTVNSGGGGDGKDDPTYNYLFGNLSTIYTNSPSVSYNTSDYGGGIYMTNRKPNTPTKLVFSGPTEPNPTDHGIINYNYASEAGGGIYIDKSAYMQMKGHCEVNANRVPEGKRGGGIYLDGRLYVGEGKDDAAGTHGLIVNKNYAITATDADFAANYSAIANGTASAAISDTYKKALNNVFLTRYESDFVLNWGDGSPSHDDDATVISLLSDISGKDTGGKPYTNIGFHVLRGFCPVVATSEEPWGSYVNTAEDNDKSIYENWLYSLMGNNSGSSSGNESSGLDVNGALFEDTDTYVAIHVRKHAGPPFLPKYIYLWGCWTYPAVNEDPEFEKPMVGTRKHYFITNSENNKPTAGPGDTLTIAVNSTARPLHWEIYSEEGLSWFSSYVNGLNVFSTGDTYTTGQGVHNDTIHRKYNKDINPYATATLMNDLDMSSHIWTPIGSVTIFNAGNIGNEQSGSTDGALFTDKEDEPHHFKGSFDGQGHIIRGVNVRYVTGIYKYGLFGYLDEGASVKNVFVDESNFITDDPNKSYTVGGIAGLVQAYGNNIVISGSEARVEIDITNADKTTSYVGGLVGKVEDGTGTIEFPNTTTGSGVVSFDRKPTLIHSSMAMPEVIGAVKYMGGLVGYLGSNDSLVNSFANPLFPEASYNDTVCLTGQYTTGENPTWVVETKEDIYFGGLVGVNNGLVENCYSRLQGDEPKSNVTTSLNYNKSIFGWIVGTNNNSNIKYCYAAKGNEASAGVPAKPGIANGGEYQRAGEGAISGHGTYDSTNLVSGKYGFKHRDQQMFDKDGTTIDADKYATTSYTDYLKYKTTNDTLIVGGLTNALNAWVKTPVNGWNATTGTNKKGYATWMRSMATIINDDYPVPMFSEFNAVGSEDSVYMHYKHDVNDLLKAYTAIPPAKHPTPAIYLYDTIRNGNEFKAITQTNIGTTNNNVMLAINEDIGILQDVNLRARVGVTFDNSNRSPLPELGGQPYDWHMFSSALNKPSMGLRYHTVDEANADNYHVWKNYANYLNSGIPNDFYNGLVPGYQREYMDPPRTYFYQSDNDQKKGYTTDKTKFGYFPANTPYGSWRAANNAATIADEDGFPAGSFDFYMYGEAYYQHWINFKRRGDATFYDHWRQDPIANGNHLNIPYPNETNMVNGRGYMMGVSQRSMLMADGTLNNGDVTYNATFTVDPSATVYDELVRGTNLIGNPYQSYLDFNLFAVGVKDGETVTAASPNNGSILGNTYYVFDADNMGYIPYTAYASDNPEVSAPRFIHPHQGFFVKIGDYNKDLQFQNNMRVAGNMTSTFRGQNLNYPLVNLLCYNSEGKRDVTTVEINRPDVGGGFKLKGMLNGKMLIYARWDNKDYQTAFTPVGIREVPVRFEVTEDDVFTMRWSTLHGDFHYLHLIDNMTGSDIDMLRATEYHFEGKTTDYKSRFKLVFEVTGLEEEDDNEDDNGSTINFAFRMGDEIIVNGEGYFELFDMQGRRLTAKQLAGSQSSVSLPNVAAGVYLLRLTGDKQVKTQKMVISY